MPRLNIPVPVPVNFKWCPCCKLVLPLADFNKDRQRKDGLRTYDRPCDTANAKAAQKRRSDLNAAGKRMTEPHRVTPAERDATNAAFVAAFTETPEARAARIATAKTAKPRKAATPRKPAAYRPYATAHDQKVWRDVCGGGH